MNYIILYFGGSSDRPSSSVKPGDKLTYGGSTQYARAAKVVDVRTQDSYLGNTDYTIQLYTIERSDGRRAYGQQFIDYRGSQKGVKISKPLSEGQSVVAWWPDKRIGINYASIANNERKKRGKKK